MKKRLLSNLAVCLLGAVLLLSWDNPDNVSVSSGIEFILPVAEPQMPDNRELADKIRSNHLFDSVYNRGIEILKTGFNAALTIRRRGYAT